MKVKGTFQGHTLEFLMSRAYPTYLPAFGSDKNMYTVSAIGKCGENTRRDILDGLDGFVDEEKTLVFRLMENVNVNEKLDFSKFSEAESVEQFLEFNNL